MLSIAVKHQCRLLAGKDAGPDAALACLTPAGVVDFRVHVGIKAVFAWLGHIPAGLRAAFSEAHADDALDALEAIFPWYDQANRCPVLVGQGFAI